MLIELLSGPADDRVCGLIDYNAATGDQHPYAVVHLSCGRADAKYMATIESHYKAQASPPVFHFYGYEEYKMGDFVATRDCCSLCGHHLTTNTEDAIMYTQSSAPP